MPNNPADWVIIAGSSGSLGHAILDHFVARGGPVLALDKRVERGGTRSADKSLLFRCVDLGSERETSETLESAIPQSMRIGLLVNVLGLIWNEPILRLRGARLQAHGADSWRRVIEANLTAPFIISTLVAARMARRGGGAIINFSSIAARGNIGQVAYSAAKAGIEGMTRAMAAELGQSGIRVNAIAPGFIDVESTHAALTEDQLTTIEERIPARRLGRSEEIIAAVDFLADNDYLNGVVLDVNGGLRL